MALLIVNSKKVHTYNHLHPCHLTLSHNMSTHQAIYTIIICWKLTLNTVKAHHTLEFFYPLHFTRARLKGARTCTNKCRETISLFIPLTTPNGHAINIFSS